MSRYTRSPQRTYNTKPQFLGTCDLEENEKTYILSLLQKLYKSSTSAEERENLQREVSQELCKHFQQSVGVSVIQGDETYLQNANFSVKREPTATAVHSGLLIRIWVKEHDVAGDSEHFQRVKG